MFQNFLDTQHRTAPRGLFRFCCERCGSKVFALCTTWSAVAGQSALVAGGCLLFEARTWLGSGRLGQTDQTVSLFQCPFCSCVLGIVFSCFLDLHYLVLLCRNGSTSNGGSTEGCGTGLSASNATVTCGHRRPDFNRPRCLPCPRLPAGELFVREPPPEVAPCSHFCFPCSTMGSPTGNLF